MSRLLHQTHRLCGRSMTFMGGYELGPVDVPVKGSFTSLHDPFVASEGLMIPPFILPQSRYKNGPIVTQSIGESAQQSAGDTSTGLLKRPVGSWFTKLQRREPVVLSALLL
ncbi:hypothetical protein M8C21_028731, partial [Ambrosia artemisiifolia]